MRTASFDLPNLLKRLRNNQFAIPQFQRTFTWRESQVKLLVDSIARNYPIGSLLVLAKSTDITLQARPVQAIIQQEESDYTGGLDSTNDISYVLDGQQRITSIARVFLNAHPDKNYYFDLKAIFEDFDKEETNWIVVRRRGNSDPDRKDKNRLLRTDVILEQQKTDIYVSEYIEDSDDFPTFKDRRTDARKAAAKIKGVFEVIRNYQIPVVTLDRDAPLESVCRVFETINSTGTRLTTFDLAVARFFPHPNLRELWEDTLNICPVLKHFDVDGERVLQVLSILNAHDTGRSPEPTRSTLLSIPASEISAKWDRAAGALVKAYEWAQFNGATPDTLPNHGILVAIAAFEAIHPLYNSSYQAILRRWYFSRVLQQGSKQAANYQIGQYFSSLLGLARGQGPNLLHPEVALSTEILIGLNKTDTRYKALQCLMTNTVHQDFYTGNKLSEVHDHHIFPRSFAKSLELPLDRLDSIVNRIPVAIKTNQSLSDTHPEEYFAKLKCEANSTGTLPDLKRRLREALIPGDPNDSAWTDTFATINFSAFCQKRGELLLERIREVVGDSLKIVDNGYVSEIEE